MKYRILLSFVVFITLIACQKQAKTDTIYFGGHIKNPKDDKVYLFKKDSNIATAKINQDHKFLFKLDSLQEGLYKFKHGEEFQYIYLEDKDSLLIRLNTWDFDGSLVFSGKGANKNNLLIQLFLENEQEERQFYSFFKLNEEDFLTKIDSFIQLKKTIFKQFKESNAKQSITFNHFINDVIYLPIYSYKEKYPFYYKKANQTKKLPQLSQSFYKHRSIIPLENMDFKEYYTYQNYLWSKVYNTAFYQLEKDTLSELSIVLLDKINQFVTDKQLKNKMLQQTYINSLVDSYCSENKKTKAKDIFFKYCNDSLKKEEISKMLKVINSLKKHKKLPEFYLKTMRDKIINSKELIGKKTVLYFWPKELNRIKNMAKRVHYLTKKYKNIRFVGVDGQLDNYNWKAYVKSNRFNVFNQFQLVDQNKNTFYTNDFPRAIIIDKNGIIVHNFTFISDSNFEFLLTK